MNQVHVKPLLPRKVTEERGRMQVPGMRPEFLDRLCELRYRRVFVTARLRKRFLRCRSARVHSALLENPAQHEPPEKDLQEPGYAKGEAIE
jgi:hypothetical protein